VQGARLLHAGHKRLWRNASMSETIDCRNGCECFVQFCPGLSFLFFSFLFLLFHGDVFSHCRSPARWMRRRFGAWLSSTPRSAFSCAPVRLSRSSSTTSTCPRSTHSICL
jgi:hypothetical protein